MAAPMPTEEQKKQAAEQHLELVNQRLQAKEKLKDLLRPFSKREISLLVNSALNDLELES